MSTCPVRFEFHCGEEELKYTHNISRSLVAAGAQVAQDTGYGNLFVKTLQPIMKEHEAICLATSNSHCENCGSRRTTVLQTPMSWLHKADDPFVVVWVNPVCEKGECESQIRQDMQDMMAELVGDAPDGRVSGPMTYLGVIPCKVCGKTEAIKRCGRCRVVGYCGKEHQKADWEVHKKICVPMRGPSS